jgi:hypothetical protein
LVVDPHGQGRLSAADPDGVASSHERLGQRLEDSRRPIQGPFRDLKLVRMGQ